MDGMLSHAWLKEAVKEGRDTIAEKTKQRQAAKAAGGSAAAPKPGGYAEAEVVMRADGVGRKGKGCGMRCVIS